MIRKAMNRAGVPPQERFNFVSHLLGAALALAALAFLVLRAQGALATSAYAIYGTSLLLMYVSSTLLHGFPRLQRERSWLRRLDHVSIYLLIAGSYTPPCLLGAPGPWGYSLLVVVWLCALFGSIEKIVRPFAPPWHATALYVAMGWLALLAIPPFVHYFSVAALLFLGGGGVVYTLGALIYASGRPDPWPTRLGSHGLWHIAVLAASGLHFVFNAFYMPAATA